MVTCLQRTLPDIYANPRVFPFNLHQRSFILFKWIYTKVAKIYGNEATLAN